MLLDEIIALATDDKQSIVVLLRKCLVLAHRLKNEQLNTWANKELNGYTSDGQLPDYRVIGADAKGDFLGVGWSQLRQRLIPPAALEEPHRRFAREVDLGQGIGVYETLVEQQDGGRITLPWPPNLVAYYQRRLMNNMALQSAYQEVPKTNVVELLDTVRTRVLNLALEIQGEVGDDDPDLKHVPPATENRINQTIVQHIYGGQGFASTGNSTMTIHQQNLTDNWENLAAALHGSGVSQGEIAELSHAVKQDGKKMGPNVMGWIKKTAPNVLTAGVKVGTSIGQQILTGFLKQHFGLG
jgi:hypothetical protein